MAGPLRLTVHLGCACCYLCRHVSFPAHLDVVPGLPPAVHVEDPAGLLDAWRDSHLAPFANVT